MLRFRLPSIYANTNPVLLTSSIQSKPCKFYRWKFYNNSELCSKCDRTAATGRRIVGGSFSKAPMPLPSEGRGRNFCVWLISFLFFLILIAGGALLLLYITLPESEGTAWLPEAGMVLVGIPWGFWIMTCVYRCVTVQGGGDRPPDKAVPFRPAGGGETAGAAAIDLPVESPGASRKVRFANATAMVDASSSDRAAAGASGAPPGIEAGGDSVSRSEVSSLNSCESEVPLAFSMT